MNEDIKEDAKIVTIEISEMEGLPCFKVTGDHTLEFYQMWQNMIDQAKREAIAELILKCTKRERAILAKEIRAVTKH